MENLITTPAPEEKPEQKPMFGHETLEKLYHDTISLLIKNKTFRMYQKSVNDAGDVEITICNTWKLTKKNGSLEICLFRKNLSTGEYEVASPKKDMGEVNLLPLNSYRSGEKLWSYLIADSIGHAFRTCRTALNWDDSKKDTTHHNSGYILNLLNIRYLGGQQSYKKRIPKDRRQYIKEEYEYVLGKTKKGRIKEAEAKVHTRAIVKNIWKELIDKELLSTVASITGFKNKLTLNRYIECSKYANSLMRHRTERPNLTPLLDKISSKYWKRDDIFSKNHWILNDEDKRSLIPKKMQHNSKSSFRWFMSQHSSFIRVALENDCSLFKHVDLLSKCQLEKKMPARIYIKLLSSASSFRNAETENTRILLIRAYSQYLKRMWRNDGYRTLVMHTQRYEYEFSDLLDWLRAEGLEGGFPDANSTWESMSARSHEWHTRSTFLRENRESFTWDSALGETTVNEISVTPLITSEELFTEGYQQHHCVGGYDYSCKDGTYRIFSLKNNAKRRYTLCIERDKKKWRVQQVRGPYNSSCPKEVHSVSAKIATMYTKAEMQISA